MLNITDSSWYKNAEEAVEGEIAITSYITNDGEV